MAAWHEPRRVDERFPARDYAISRGWAILFFAAFIVSLFYVSFLPMGPQ